jgi:hypothetical protein
MTYVQQVRIGAGPALVWEVLTDVQGWRRWTASVKLIRRTEQAGPFGTGSEALVKQPRLPVALYRVTSFEAPAVPGAECAFVWETRVPGLRTVAGHRVEPSGGGSLVTLELRQAGPLAPFAALAYGRLIRRYLAMESDGLRQYCELRAG